MGTAGNSKETMGAGLLSDNKKITFIIDEKQKVLKICINFFKSSKSCCVIIPVAIGQLITSVLREYIDRA